MAEVKTGITFALYATELRKAVGVGVHDLKLAKCWIFGEAKVVKLHVVVG